MTEKLHKVLARAGLGSRREIETWIAQGRVAVDGEVASPGLRVSAHNQIAVDGRRVALPATTGSAADRILLYHKPIGEISSRRDPKHGKTVFDGLPRVAGQRWVAVGRLDLNTSGLLLFTTSGELAARLMHPSAQIEREYLVRVQGRFTRADLDRLRRGIELDGRMARFEHVAPQNATGGSNAWYRVIIREGRYREVRRLWNAVGGRVGRLKRVRFGPVALPRDLRPGAWRELSRTQVLALREAAGDRRAD